MKLNETEINSAGVFRCCIESVHKSQLDKEVTEGEHIPCLYGKKCEGMTLHKGTWIAGWIYKRDHA